MPITDQKIRSLAELVRLDLEAGKNPQEAALYVASMAQQLNTLIENISCITSADTTDIAPLYSPMTHTAPPRPDVAMTQRSTESMLVNAQEKNGSFFVVPPVL